MEIPCRPDCPNRRPACHSVCPEYKAYRKYLDGKNEAIRKGNEVFNYNGIRKARIKEIMRRINKRGGDGG